MYPNLTKVMKSHCKEKFEDDDQHNHQNVN